MDSKDIISIRNDIHDVLQKQMPQGKFVIGWAMIVESIDMDTGNRWLARIDGAGEGKGVPAWQRAGYFHDGLHGNWDVTHDDEFNT